MRKVIQEEENEVFGEHSNHSNADRSSNGRHSVSPKRRQESSSKSPQRRKSRTCSKSPRRKRDSSYSKSSKKKMERSYYSKSPRSKRDRNYSDSPRKNRERSCSESPRRKSDKSYSKSSRRKRGRSYSKSPRRNRDRSYCKSPRRKRDRSYSKSPRRNRDRSYSKSPRRKRDRSYSKSARRYRGRSYSSPRRNKRRSYSKSPSRKRDRSYSKTPRRNQDRSYSKSPKRKRSNSMSPKRKRDQSCSNSTRQKMERSYSKCYSNTVEQDNKMFECLELVPSSTEEDIQIALEISNWDVAEAVKQLKIDILMKCPLSEWKIGLQKNQNVCKIALNSVNWNLELANMRVRGNSLSNVDKPKVNAEDHVIASQNIQLIEDEGNHSNNDKDMDSHLEDEVNVLDQRIILNEQTKGNKLKKHKDNSVKPAEEKSSNFSKSTDDTNYQVAKASGDEGPRTLGKSGSKSKPVQVSVKKLNLNQQWITAANQSKFKQQKIVTENLTLGQIMLHKIKGCPHWPVEIENLTDTSVQIRYFGTNETGVVKNLSTLHMYNDDNIKKFQLKLKKSSKLKITIAQANDEILKRN